MICSVTGHNKKKAQALIVWTMCTMLQKFTVQNVSTNETLYIKFKLFSIAQPAGLIAFKRPKHRLTLKENFKWKNWLFFFL